MNPSTESFMKECRVCPRNCSADRLSDQKGFCRVGAEIILARAALHMWEEPCISGKEGSGAVFFSGCSLGCKFCQNGQISRGQTGKKVTADRLADIFLYNSSGYEKSEMLKLLEGLVDIYLPDFKYMDPELAEKYSYARDYPEVAREALKEMVRQTGTPEFDRQGIMKKGVIVRHLLLPGHVKDSRRVLEYLLSTYGKGIYISLMNQYTPMPAMKDDPRLSRKVTDREYQRLIDYGLQLGLENGFIQEGETAKESFIPEFNGEGI